MVILNDGDLLNLSKQLENTVFNFTRTFPFSFRRYGYDTIELSPTEYRICSLLFTPKSLEQLQVELCGEFDYLTIENVYNKLISLDIIVKCSPTSKSKARMLTPYEKSIVGIRHFPRVIVWNITNKCNLYCRHCISNYFKSQEEKILNADLIDKLIEEMNTNCLERLQISGGEPLCSPYFNYILERTLRTNICIDIFTNATLITEEHHKLFNNYIKQKPNMLTFHISVDGDQDSHNYLRQNDTAYQRTKYNIEKILKYNGIVNIETIIHSKNLDLLEKYINILIEMHIQYVYMHPAFHLGNNEKIQEQDLSIDQRTIVFQKMMKLKNKYKEEITINYADPYFPISPHFIKNILHLLPEVPVLKDVYSPINCVAGLEKMFINCEGEIYPCLLYNKMARDYCGNISNTSLANAWKSTGMDHIRRPIYDSDLPCFNCRYSMYCKGKIKSCRRAIEMMSGHYYDIAPACMDIL